MPRKRKGFLIYGTVTTEDSGRPVPNLIVEALDKDLFFDDRLGSVITDNSGKFEIQYARSDFQEIFFDHKPDIYLRVRRADGTVIRTTEDKVRYNAGRTEAFQILVPEDELDSGGSIMENTIKLVIDLNEIKQDPELGEELLKDDKPIKVAAVRKGEVLTSVEIDVSKVKDFSKVPVTLKFDYPGDIVPGAYVMIGPNLADREFLGIEARKLWVSPRQFSDGVADLSASKLAIHPYLFRRWLWLCRTFTITGRVVKRVGDCDEPVPGATVQAYDVDCWWFWWRRDLITSTTTNADGTFEMSFRWCCLIRLPYFKVPWTINPDLLKRLTEALIPKIGPIPPETLKDPTIFEDFLNQRLSREVPSLAAPPLLARANILPRTGSEVKTPVIPLPPPKLQQTRLLSDRVISKPVASLLDSLRPIFPGWRCWPFWPKDCTPDVVFRVSQECEGEEQVIYDEGPFQTRWNIPNPLDVTLLANEDACSIPCEEPPVGEDCVKFYGVNCVGDDNIGMDSGSPDLRGYAYPGSGDNPFTGTIRIRGAFGAGSDIDYFKPQYAFNGGSFVDFPEEKLVAFSRRYWAPPPGSPSGTSPKWNYVRLKPEDVPSGSDTEVVYKTQKKLEDENPLPPPAEWPWGYLWGSLNSTTLFYWNSQDFEGDGLYTIRLLGYRWNSTTESLEDEHVMETCDIDPSAHEHIMVRIDNRLDDDPTHPSTDAHPCGSGTIHRCTYEPDCDFVYLEHVTTEGTTTIGPCDIIELADTDQIVIHFLASDQDGHLQGYHMHAHWKENRVFNILAAGLLEPDFSTPVGPTYSDVFIEDPGHVRPFWYGGRFKVTVDGSAFLDSCAYTLQMRAWKRTIRSCLDPYHVHYNRSSYSFTIQKV